MQIHVFRFLAPALLLASSFLPRLSASTFGGGTGPRQNTGIDADLPKLEVDSMTYRRTRARLSVEDAVPLFLPDRSYVVRKESQAIVEYNNAFELVSRY